MEGDLGRLRGDGEKKRVGECMVDGWMKGLLLVSRELDGWLS